ncbi:MAG: undecaprenyl-diphosphatase [Patescibacteria group bacterium]|nr:undecaprenyl-diphosphatase [Patescibacteria group bacterium]
MRYALHDSMTFFQAIIFGLVQGLGEFLPISSSGHLVLAPWLFGFPDPGLPFDVALHLGTLFAVVLYFAKDFMKIVKSILPSRDSISGTGDTISTSPFYNRNLLWLLVIATVPGAIAGYFLENYAETVFRNPLLIAGTLSLVGLILYLADRYAKHRRGIVDMNFKDAVVIGVSQALAIVPGVSRAGSTITAGLFLGLNRVSAARFSFLMSAPIIFGATVLKLPEFISHGIDFYEIVAIATAALSGYFAIAFMISFIEKVSYKIFFWYRLALAILILTVWLIK